jgi:hypothetical protein
MRMRCVSTTHTPKQRLLGESGRLGIGRQRKLFFFHTRRAFRKWEEYSIFLRDGMLFPLFTVHHKEAL